MSCLHFKYSICFGFIIIHFNFTIFFSQFCSPTYNHCGIKATQSILTARLKIPTDRNFGPAANWAHTLHVHSTAQWQWATCMQRLELCQDLLIDCRLPRRHVCHIESSLVLRRSGTPCWVQTFVKCSNASCTLRFTPAGVHLTFALLLLSPRCTHSQHTMANNIVTVWWWTSVSVKDRYCGSKMGSKLSCKSLQIEALFVSAVLAHLFHPSTGGFTKNACHSRTPKWSISNVCFLFPRKTGLLHKRNECRKDKPTWHDKSLRAKCVDTNFTSTSSKLLWRTLVPRLSYILRASGKDSPGFRWNFISDAKQELSFLARAYRRIKTILHKTNIFIRVQRQNTVALSQCQQCRN